MDEQIRKSDQLKPDGIDEVVSEGTDQLVSDETVSQNAASTEMRHESQYQPRTEPISGHGWDDHGGKLIRDWYQATLWQLWMNGSICVFSLLGLLLIWLLPKAPFVYELMVVCLAMVCIGALFPSLMLLPEYRYLRRVLRYVPHLPATPVPITILPTRPLLFGSEFAIADGEMRGNYIVRTGRPLFSFYAKKEAVAMTASVIVDPISGQALGIEIDGARFALMKTGILRAAFRKLMGG